MKNLLNFIKNCLKFILWTMFFTFVFKNLLYIFWRFDILSTRSWKTLFIYWNNGGVFKTAPDIILLILLFSTPFLFFFGFIKARKINYFQKIFSCFCFFYKEKNSEPEQITIKGMKTTDQFIEEIKNEIESLKPEKNEEAGSIRTNVLKKLNNDIKK